MATQTQSERVTYSFFSSTLIHAGLAVAVLTMKITVPESSTMELVQIDLQESAPLIEKAIQNSPAPVGSLPPKQTKTIPPATPSSQLETTTVLNQENETEAFAASLETPTSTDVADLDENSINEAFEQVNQEPVEGVEATAFTEADSVINESEILAQQAKRAQIEQLAIAEKNSAEQQARDRERLEQERAAQIRAAADSAAQKSALAKVQSEEQARTRAAELAAARSRFESEKNNAIEALRKKRGELASATGGAGAAPVGEIRRLEDLRQMPGNRVPQYDSEDRLARRSGDVILLAFISKEGRPTTFKMVQTSGHRSLDYKTLKAVRDWKFYPGQEGWVEIPFRWDLKGEPRPIGGTLRKYSRK